MESILYKNEHKINKYITIKIPTLGEVFNNELSYYNGIALLTATPHSMMVQLDDKNIDFTTLSDWDLFLHLFNDLKNSDLSLIFKDLDLGEYEVMVDRKIDELVCVNQKTGAIIDRAIHDEIGRVLRKILCTEKEIKKPANEEAKKYMIERARTKMKRSKQTIPKSYLEPQIVALVNAPEFPYDYNSILNLTIYQFNVSLNQVIKRIKFDNLMTGYYMGTVNIEDINQSELNWIA